MWSNEGTVDDVDVQRRMRRYRYLTWAALIVGYTGIYFSRTSLSLVTTDIKQEYGFTGTEWGVLISCGCDHDCCC